MRSISLVVPLAAGGAVDTAARITAEKLRERLQQNRLTCPLFDTDRFRRHLEAAYQAMWETYVRGESPRSFAVPREP